MDVEIRQNYLPAVCCSWLDETKLLVGYASGSIKLWNIQNQGHKGKRHNDCQNLEICPKKYINSLTDSSPMFIPWKECLSTITEQRVVLQITTSPTGDAFITAGNNQLIYIYSVHTLQKIMTCEPSATNDIMDGHKSSGLDSTHRITMKIVE